MTYCLMTEDKKVRVEIRCSLADRPETVAQLLIGIHDGRIELISPKKLSDKYRELKELTLDTDWERTGTNLRQINWPAIENLK